MLSPYILCFDIIVILYVGFIQVGRRVCKEKVRNFQHLFILELY